VTTVQKLTEHINSGDKDLDEIALNNPELRILKSKSETMKRVIQLVKQVSDSSATVLIQGETGTGKELIAQTIHQLSRRKKMALIKCNCSAIPETLIESELFGYEKGAFTGAVQRKPGRFELADGGTLFLDEIGELPLMIQAKILRAIQEKEFERLGGIKTIKTDIRIITATNKDLEQEVLNGKFREDLFYRLNVVNIQIPPLRNRKVKTISKSVQEIFMNYKWHGNIRELENVIERCVIVTNGSVIELEDLPDKLRKSGLVFVSSENTLEDCIDKTECQMLKDALNKCKGNRTKASEMLGISRRSLHRKIAKFQIED